MNLGRITDRPSHCTLLEAHSHACPIRLRHAGILYFPMAMQAMRKTDLNRLQRIRYKQRVGHERLVREGCEHERFLRK